MGKKSHRRSQGFTLIAALLLLLLLSGLAVGLMYMVNSESHIGGNDINYNIAYYSAESGMEKLTADLAALYQSSQTPTPANITNLTNFPPTAMGSMNYAETITWAADAAGNPISNWNTISAGNNQGLKALIVPYTLTVNATQPLSNASANITRSVEVALIPVFQFGIFADGDIDYFAGPAFTFKGRVHTNGNLYLASGSSLALYDKTTAFGEIVTDRLENGHPTSSGYGGTIYIPNASGGCDTSLTGTHCLASSAFNPASWSGGIPPSVGGTTSGWVGTSQTTYKGFVANSATGVRRLNLPFVGPGVLPVQIIRKPILNEALGTTLSSSRLYNKAQIRVLLADTLADLHPERGAGALDGEDVLLSNNAFNGVAVARALFWCGPQLGSSFRATGSQQLAAGGRISTGGIQERRWKLGGHDQPVAEPWLQPGLEYSQCSGHFQSRESECHSDPATTGRSRNWHRHHHGGGQPAGCK